MPRTACQTARRPANDVNSPMPRILYTGTQNASSWAFRAWLALKEAEVEFQEEVVDIRKPQRFANLAKVGTFAPPAAVPVLVDADAVIYDSLAIMEYANDLCGGRLLPSDVKKRARARALTAWQHAGLSGICARISFESAFYPDRRDLTADELSQAVRIFDVWESELRQSGGPFLLGDLSLADLAFVPTVVRLTAHVKSVDQWPLLRLWIERLLSRPSVKTWMDVANSLPPVYLDDYRIERN